MDKRSQRTREALRQALVRLMLRRDYSLISPQDIVAEAGVSRSTFYAHYASKDDLLARSLNHLREELLDSLDGGGQAQDLWNLSRRYFAHLHTHKALQHAIRGGPADAIVRGTIDKILVELLQRCILAPWREPLPRALAARHIAGAFSLVSTWWLDTGATVEEAEQHLRTLVARGAAAGVLPARREEPHHLRP